MTGWRLLPAGDRAVLVELPDLASVHQLHRAVLSAGLAEDAVPGERTLLLVGDRPERLAAALATIDAERLRTDVLPPRIHEVPVRYDGPDLDEVAIACGLPVDEVVAAHTAAPWTVAFLGFRAGFPYLVGGDPRLHVDRLPTPRTTVPAGSVALAAGYTGIYPAASPGGWRLIGRTETVLFDPAADPPARMSPGDVVRFAAVG
jgi:KipI family sensor histidine kinase inhibitor